MPPPPTAAVRTKAALTAVDGDEAASDAAHYPYSHHSHGHGHGHSHGHQSESQRGIMAEIIASIYEPGINRGLLVLMHLSFLTLLVSLAVMLWMTRGRNVHVLILAVIAASLYAIIVWFIRELDATLAKQQELIDKKE